MFPPKSGPKGRQTRSVGSPKSQLIAFRAPEDLLAYVEEMSKNGYAKTEIVLGLCYVAMEAVVEMGNAWWELERRAASDGIPRGKALGRYAALGLKVKKP